MASIHDLFKTPEALRHNVRIKTYPDGWKNVLICKTAVFSEPGWVPAGEVRDDGAWEIPTPDIFETGVYDNEDRVVEWEHAEAARAAANLDRSMRRARSQVRDIALCTPFKYFVTLTLDEGQVDRYDIVAVTRKLTAWCDNQVRRHGLSYVLVPELHRDGAIHFHGFFNGALEAVDSGTMTQAGGKPRRPRTEAQRALWASQGEHTVFNLPAWSLGFTTAIELYGDYRKAVSYVCKYIGKSQGPQGGNPGKIGGRWYYSGGDLGRPQVDYTDLLDEDFNGMAAMDGAYTFAINAAGLLFVAFTVAAKGGEASGKALQPGPELPLVGKLPLSPMLEVHAQHGGGG